MDKLEEKELLKQDLKYVWHPDTQMKDCEKGELPIIIERGEGIYVYDVHGNKYIDAVASWWVNTLGHSNKRLNKALCAQAEKLEHVIFAGFTHTGAIELAKALVEMTCDNLTKVFYSDNGSTAVEVALKIAYQYQQQIGKTKKTKFVALENSYHGDTLGAVSVGSLDVYSKIYKPLLFEIFRADSPYCYRCPCDKEKETCECECLHSVENIFRNHAEEIVGIIVEPLVQGAAGMLIYKPLYLQKLRALCDKYDILLIHDEVAVGFGRTGKMFAYEHAGIEPDILCLAKGITAGYLPLSVTMTSEKIYKAFYDDYDTMKAFYHGHSYTANPLAISVALENLKIFEEDKIMEQIQEKSQFLENELQRLKDLKHVGDVRQIGMIVGIELVEDKTTKQSFDSKKRMGHQVYKKALKKGAILRPLGDVIYFMPPYIISKDEIKTLVDITFESIKEL